MRIGITNAGGRVCPCFPGVGVRIVDLENAAGGLDVATGEWNYLSWPRELMQRDVGVLVCSGIDRFLIGALQGYGIEVMPMGAGLVEDVVRNLSAAGGSASGGKLETGNSGFGKRVCGRGRRKGQRGKCRT